ncbi:hypothetical protein NLY43_25425 [Mesorhizobium sp. C416B]|uniref:hypothetical protein n=1 Tax=unclassified Mesorhizobium TaxID=325217 RepID=UPI0003CE1414|nr:MULTISPECIES: hypothetical protein [unclassified Mesorhizobium]ESX37983.1 hypothetical protein X762_32020 [Mesorhizobium sp. LSHC426A00]ESX43436.1 hypothetical protein X761_32980 [Mesorhizobium sp. LSHC424B00]ESX73108.1 hypothetical protein X758_12095 [Mesorhizobium sp. LSHC416B00]WJI61916.1 hypothetical protein NLY43_25425 [Mesorhizobium sp. C416B]
MASRLAPQIAGNGHVCDHLQEKDRGNAASSYRRSEARKIQHPDDAHLYTERNVIERFSNSSSSAAPIHTTTTIC